MMGGGFTTPAINDSEQVGLCLLSRGDVQPGNRFYSWCRTFKQQKQPPTVKEVKQQMFSEDSAVGLLYMTPARGKFEFCGFGLLAQDLQIWRYPGFV